MGCVGQYYSLDDLLSKNALYSMVFGERSKGKTFACLELIIKNYAKDGSQGAYIRRWQDDFRGGNAEVLFSAHVSLGLIAKYTSNKWTDVYYKSRRWYFCRYEDEKRIVDKEPFCFAFALSRTEHDKSTSYPKVTTIVFDEYCPIGGYCSNNEFGLFKNTISTIIRQRDNVRIIMCANSIDPWCQYYQDMYVTNAEFMTPGDIDIYKHPKTGEIVVAIEYTEPNIEGKASDKFFDFGGDENDDMITKGGWDFDSYPHCPCDYKPKDILYSFFVCYSNNIVQCDIIGVDSGIFIYAHRKTGDIKFPDADLVFTTEYDIRPNFRRNILKPILPVEKEIALLMKADKMFYQDNRIGALIDSYKKWCLNA